MLREIDKRIIDIQGGINYDRYQKGKVVGLNRAREIITKFRVEVEAIKEKVLMLAENKPKTTERLELEAKAEVLVQVVKLIDGEGYVEYGIFKENR